MSTNITNQVAYLPTTRSFPEDPEQLVQELNKAYVDIANNVNRRVIGSFPIHNPAITGESWYFTNQKQQGLRKVYVFTSTADIDIGFKINTIGRFTRFYGVYISGTATFGLIPGTSVGIVGQIVFYVDVNPLSTVSDVIKFVASGTAPLLSSGTLVLEWVSSV